VHKLLFDNNISHRVIARILDIFPDANHVMLENLDEVSDTKVWMHARSHNYTILIKDSLQCCRCDHVAQMMIYSCDTVTPTNSISLNCKLLIKDAQKHIKNLWRATNSPPVPTRVIIS